MDVFIYSTLDGKAAYESLMSISSGIVEVLSSDVTKELDKNRVTAVVHNHNALPPGKAFKANSMVQVAYFPQDCPTYRVGLELIAKRLENIRAFNLLSEEQNLSDL